MDYGMRRSLLYKDMSGIWLEYIYMHCTSWMIFAYPYMAVKALSQYMLQD